MGDVSRSNSSRNLLDLGVPGCPRFSESGNRVLIILSSASRSRKDSVSETMSEE
jgi:hypothetical protein